MANDGGSAFPHFGKRDQDLTEPRMTVEPGMSLRDYFAGQALKGLLSSADFGTATVRTTFEHYSACAYHHADAMLAERAK